MLTVTEVFDLKQAVNGAISMLSTVHLCSSNTCEDCQEHACLHRNHLQSVLPLLEKLSQQAVPAAPVVAQQEAAQPVAMTDTHSQLPWRITEPNERKNREIVCARGSTIAKLTALDMANATLIVQAVNGIGQQDTRQPSFPERDTSKPTEQQGLFRKFEVRRVDGSDQSGGKHYGCRYYVLDLTHDQHAPAAMCAYAAACRTTHPQLADDIEREFGAQDTRNSALEEAAKGFEMFFASKDMLDVGYVVESIRSMKKTTAQQGQQKENN